MFYFFRKVGDRSIWVGFYKGDWKWSIWSGPFRWMAVTYPGSYQGHQWRLHVWRGFHWRGQSDDVRTYKQHTDKYHALVSWKQHELWRQPHLDLCHNFAQARCVTQVPYLISVWPGWIVLYFQTSMSSCIKWDESTYLTGSMCELNKRIYVSDETGELPWHLCRTPCEGGGSFTQLLCAHLRDGEHAGEPEWALLGSSPTTVSGGVTLLF